MNTLRLVGIAAAVVCGIVLFLFLVLFAVAAYYDKRSSPDHDWNDSEALFALVAFIVLALVAGLFALLGHYVWHTL